MSRWPGSSEWLYAGKTFAAAMIALYVALSIGLERPYWAMATVYVVSQPLTGALRSRAIYRLIGTIVGAAVDVVLVPNLDNAPVLLSAALALWTGFCLYISLLDRSARAYLFLLAGFTATVVGFPTVTTPEQIWNVALARVEGIGLGVICSTVVGTVVFPRALGPLVSARILAWVTKAFAWTEAMLRGDTDIAGSVAPSRLAADAVELRMLSSQLAYDTSKYQAVTRWVIELQRRMVLLLPLLSSIGDRLAALRASNGMTPKLEQMLADMGVWMRAGTYPPRSESDRMRGLIVECQAETDPRAGWNETMRASLLQRLRQLVDLRQDLRDLRQHIETGGGALSTPLTFQLRAPDRLHVDHRLALLSGLAATVTILTVCTFWIATGWQSGGAMAALASAACCLFATLDDPTPAIKRFLFAAVLSVAAVGVGLFGILPRVHDFEILALSLGIFFIPVGLLTAMPATQPLGIGLGFLTATLLSLQSTYAADFVTYADGGFADMLGIACAAVVTAMLRSVGAEWSARRLLRANWHDLAALPRHHAPAERDAMPGLLLDRIGLLVPRLAALGPGNDLAAVDALGDLRIGINMADMHCDRDAVPLPVRAAVDDVLAGVAGHFAAQAAAGRQQPPSPDLLPAIDRALNAAITVPGERAADLLLQLVGIRRGLFAAAAPFQPTASSGDANAAEMASMVAA
jgi:uncharacterized membrane protein YccC